VVAAAVYVFGLERYRPFVRPAILTAFLGYVAVAVGLLYDLGLPWHIWHPMVYWQYHSVLFEVAACVMLYLTVLALEFAPVVLEHPRLDRPWLRALLHGLRRVTIPLVIAGITLSTLHQSSLGSLFLITPYRLHPLWYSPIMYVLFLISAVGLGLMTVVLESALAAHFLNHRVHTDRLAGLGVAAAVVLLGYAALRVGDLAVRGVLGATFGSSWHSTLFVLELLVSAALPAALLLIPRVRRSLAGMTLCAALTVAGMVGYRLNVSIVAFARPGRFGYFPSWMEIAVSLGIVAGAALVFIFFVERFRVFEEGPVTSAAPRVSFDPATLHGLLPVRLAAPRRFSLAAVVAASLTVLALPREATLGARPAATPVAAARTTDGLPVPRGERGRLLVLAGHDDGGSAAIPVLLIDGNRNGDATLLDHQGHVDRLGGDTACGICHHLDVPYDRQTACVACHRVCPVPRPRRAPQLRGRHALRGLSRGPRRDGRVHPRARGALGGRRRVCGGHARPLPRLPRAGARPGTGAVSGGPRPLRHLPQRRPPGRAAGPGARGAARARHRRPAARTRRRTMTGTSP